MPGFPLFLRDECQAKWSVVIWVILFALFSYWHDIGNRFPWFPWHSRIYLAEHHCDIKGQVFPVAGCKESGAKDLMFIGGRCCPRTKKQVMICVQYLSLHLQNSGIVISTFCILKMLLCLLTGLWASLGDASFPTYCKIMWIPSVLDVDFSVMFLTFPNHFWHYMISISC